MLEFSFFVLALISVGSALGVVLAKDPIRSALWLISAFIGIAGEFIILHAQFIAMLQVIVYAGAIAVMIILTIMTMDRMTVSGVRRFNPQPIWGIAIGVGLLFDLVVLMAKVRINESSAGKNLVFHGSNVRMVGEVLFKHYLLPFEIVAIILLVALIGAVYLGRRGL